MLLGLVASLVAGLVAGGRIGNLATARLRWPLVGAFGTLALVGHAIVPSLDAADSLDGPWWLIAGTALLGVVAARNAIAAPGLAVAAVGFGLNVIVMAANGAMPIDLDASLDAGNPLSATAFDEGSAFEPVDDDTRLAFLARRIPVDVLSETLSWGDVALALGFAGFVYQAVVGDDEDVLEPVPAAASAAGGPPLPGTLPGMVWFGTEDPIAIPELVGPPPSSAVLELPEGQVGDVFWAEWTRQQARAQLRRRYLIDLTAAEPDLLPRAPAKPLGAKR